MQCACKRYVHGYAFVFPAVIDVPLCACMLIVQALRPNIFVSVPRLWNRIYDRVMAQIRESNPVKRALFEKAYAYKKAALEAGDLSGGRWGPLFDKLVFSKIRERVGGEVKYMTTGKR